MPFLLHKPCQTLKTIAICFSVYFYYLTLLLDLSPISSLTINILCTILTICQIKCLWNSY